MTMHAKRKAKGLQCQWQSSDKEKTIKAVEEKKIGLYKASREFNVPKTTLRRHLNDSNKFAKNGKKHW